MSAQTLNRWGGTFVIVVAVLTLVGGLIRFVALKNGGDLLPGQSLYTAVYLVGGFTFIALYAPYATQMGKLGFAGFILSFLGITFSSIPAFLWLAIAAGQEWGHAALMFSWGTVPVLVIGGLAAMVGYILFGIAAARSEVYPRWAAYGLVASAVIDLPVELPMIGAMFEMIWPVSLVLYAVSLAWMGYTLVRAGKQLSATTTPASKPVLA